MAGVKFQLNRLMFERGMNVPELVRKSGVNRNTLYAIKNNALNRVDLGVLERICDALPCSLSDLVVYEPAGGDERPVIRFNPAFKRDREGRIFIISGPSGAGKNTLINHLKEINLGVHYIPSFTTREMREGETQGNPYHFVDLASFKAMIDRHEFLEYEQIHGNYYGTHAKTYEYAIRHGYDVLKDIDVNGALNFRKWFRDHVVLIYVRPTDLSALAGRLTGRGDSLEEIQVRMKRIEFEESKRDQFDYLIYNDDVLAARDELLAILRREGVL
ncbi:guanylate kinase [Alicyclobacillus cycloheptanicus]|uniref:Guanylate kinase n=1 Tax=Alicyclobacillus cycloheptanicus TaxID=1457 RepID=A0ABT9XEJ6_9BACL|nr:guanylate kinase [Alicyclobacillus cycloheptanicus]MDQ0188612.1 guanylate kinase [Alicyclobacillus cycloheptanicus]WDM00705.1 guanylate kinase [Alicyclobacillus cycloheptanicus]